MENNTKIFEINAVWNEHEYRHFGIHPKTAALYGDSVDDIEIFKLKISDDQTIPPPNSKYLEVDYWGWLDTDNKLSMIYGQRFLLDMCFPAGIVKTENVGQGKAYRLEIVL